MIDHRELRRLLGTLRVIESVALLGRASSTNALARRAIDESIENELAVPPSLVIAEEQTAGRGRGANRWESRRGGIYATLMLRRKREDIAVLPMEIAVMVARFLRTVYGIDATIKWPNDIQVSGSKIAGILIEAKSSGEEVYLMIGIGLNVQPLDTTSLKATSIVEASDRPATVDDAIIHFIQSLDSSLFSCPSNEETMTQWREWSAHREGDSISAQIGEQRVEGSWAGIDERGHARLRRADGSILEIASGEILQHS